MSPSTALLLLGVLVVSSALLVVVVLDTWVGATRVRRRVECPGDRRYYLATVDRDPVAHRFGAVRRCERLGGGPVSCEMGCVARLNEGYVETTAGRRPYRSR